MKTWNYFRLVLLLATLSSSGLFAMQGSGGPSFDGRSPANVLLDNLLREAQEEVARLQASVNCQPVETLNQRMHREVGSAREQIRQAKMGLLGIHQEKKFKTKIQKIWQADQQIKPAFNRIRQWQAFCQQQMSQGQTERYYYKGVLCEKRLTADGVLWYCLQEGCRYYYVCKSSLDRHIKDNHVRNKKR